MFAVCIRISFLCTQIGWEEMTCCVLSGM